MMMMLAQVASSFIAPALAGAGAAAIAVPIAIHLLSRLRRKRQRWGAMRFLRLAYQKQKNRLRLEQWLLLATRCLLVLLIGLALAGPVVGGAVARWLSGAGGGGRTVHVVIDDALTSAVVENAANATNTANPESESDAASSRTASSRLDALKRDASALLDALGAGDRVVLWRSTRPDAALEGAAGSLGAVRSALDELEPAPVAADWPRLVSAISAKVERDAAAARPVVTVLSGFARGDGALTEPAPAGLVMLADRAAVALRRPAASRPNRQISAVVPRRAVVVQQGGGAAGSVNVSLTVRRFEDAAESASALVRVELLRVPNDAGADELAAQVVATAERDVSWSVGQSEVALSVAVALPALPEGFDREALAVRAVLLGRVGASATAEDALWLDDESFAVVEAVRLLRVGVQGGETAASPETADSSGTTGAVSATNTNDLGPAVFVRAALGGGAGVGSSGIESSALARIDVGALEGLDAVFVLSPALVGPEGWSALAPWVEAGGVLWVMPDADTRGSLNWPALMSRALGEALPLAGDVTELAEGASLAEGAGAPEALSLLSGSWSALLGPVRVNRVVNVSADAEVEDVPSGSETRDTPNDNTDTTDNTATRSSSTSSPGARPGAAVWLSWGGAESPWLVAQPAGKGTVLWLGSALDPSWTNLPAKPLFPALVQDALRSAVSQRLGRRAWPADERPPGGLNVAEAQRVRMGDASGSISNNTNGTDATGAATDATTDRTRRLDLDAPAPRPGLYVLPRSGDAPVLVAINPEAKAGDARALDETALSAWWDALGAWSWLPEAPAEFLASESPRAALHMWLLWAVLALVLLEAWLSRVFSHATTDRPGLRRRAMTVIDHWRLGEFADRARRKAA